jgi:hypothetical protein
MKRKKLRDHIIFVFLGHQVYLETKQLKITNLFTYKYVVIRHIKKWKEF